MDRVEGLERLALVAREAVSRRVRLEAAELVLQEHPGDERAEVQYGEALAAWRGVWNRLLLRQIVELAQDGWAVVPPADREPLDCPHSEAVLVW